VELEERIASASQASNATLAETLSAERREVATVQLPQLLQRAIKAYPGNAETWTELAALEGRRATGDQGKMKTLLATIKRLRPSASEPYVMMATTLASQMRAADAAGRSEHALALAEQAEAEMAQAIRRYPAHADFRRRHAELLARLSRNAEAIEEYRRAIDFAERTSEKEAKLSPEELEAIEARIRELEATLE
jgi:tetratricopeptide (TPR) repeat protein